MKKIFLIALAAIGMTACMQEEVMDTPTGGAITFDKAFVGNATKAVVTTDNLEAFKVWGYVNQPSGKLFEGTEVTKAGDAWTYQGTQYWAPENEYHFAAIAPVSSQWALSAYPGTLTFENDGATDLIYAAKQVTSAAAGNTNSAVAFEFDHLLSKVKLNFTNGFPTENVTVALTEIKMATPQTAEMAIASGEACVWANFGANKDFTFADKQLAYAAPAATTEEYFILPYDAVISFKVNVLVGDQPVYTGVKTATLPAATFEMGHAYNLSAVINADVLNFDEIEFTVNQVDAWVEAPNASDKAANLIYAAQIGGEITLEEDVVLDAPVVVPAGVELVLNLNGKTIKNSTQSEVFGEGEGIIAYGNLTINGEGTVEGSTMAVWARGNNGAKITINGGTYKGCAEGFAKGGRSVIYASSDNTIDIYGGTFEALAADKTSFANKTEGVYPVLNVADNHGMINVYGGTFVGQNPAAPGTEPAAWNTAHPNGFVAPYYKSTQNGNEWTVALDAVYTTAELQAAINAGQAHINLAPGVTFDGTVYMKSNVTIEGLEGATMHNINLNGADHVTLKNIIFDAANAIPCVNGKGEYRVYANIVTGIWAEEQSIKGARNVVIDGCTFNGTFKTGKPGAAIAFTDQHRKSGYSGNITIKNCTFETVNDFGAYDIYGYYAGYENFVIEDNTFKSEFPNGCPIFLGSYASGTPIVVKNNNFEKVGSLDEAMYTSSNSNLHNVTTDASNNTFAN